ncbi:MAG: 50S ribosomal protein L30 [Armatimonadetes bacterium]|nr:50S ribosomal protein L30 [Armatimonadota bacterium]
MLKVTLKKSVIGYNRRQRATVRALGLNKVGSWHLHVPSESVLGMIRSVRHLVSVEELPEPVEVGNEA